ncbi:hypothetical protein [Methylococcus capsulatus]|uniref:hypothetical protein n=1 Tax=Methylococcus capsulatus TaxID=414 RepID=UPI002FDAE1B3
MSLEDQIKDLERMAEPAARKARKEARQYGSTAVRNRAPSRAQGGDVDTNIAPPKATDDMFYGLVGDVARAAAHRTEVNPVAAAAGFLSFLGAMVGRDVYYPIANANHHANLFTLHVGRSSRGGKGEALNLTRRISRVIAQDHPALLGQTHSGGLSSREGLAMLIHDGWTQGRETIEPIHDKRLWVIEGEFANVLAQAKRDGNTLSAALREIWDGADIKPATKTSRVWASSPHIGMACAITPSELHSTIHPRELGNGFANRFLMFWAERPCSVPDPEPTPADVLAELAARTAAVIAFAKGEYPKAKDTRAMHRSHAATSLWKRTYDNLKRPMESELLTGILERRPPYAARLAMLFALCDQSLVIEEWHLAAALAWVRYWEGSVRYVFANQAQEARAMEREGMAARIVEFLSGRPEGATAWDIHDVCFAKKKTPIPVPEVLHMLISEPLRGVEMEERPRADGRAGRGAKIYRLSKNSGGVSGVRGMARPPDDFEPSEFGGVSFSDGEILENSNLTPPNSDTEKTAGTRMNALTPLTPLTPTRKLRILGPVTAESEGEQAYPNRPLTTL